MLCISRYTDDTYAQQFGDGRHKFYLEFRCNRPTLKGMDCCAKCAEKSSTTVLQHSRKFNHGNVNEPIPDNSHIYGGKWYYDGARKWGLPPSEIIEFAIQYQKEARGDFVIEEQNTELYADKKQSVSEEMVRAKKIDTQPPDETVAPVKRSRKPKVAPAESETIATETQEAPKPVKRTRKPKVATESTEETPVTTTEPKKKAAPRKKATETAYSNLVSTTNRMVHKEVSLPTHIETKLEEIDSEGYQIDYVKLSPFEANGTTYFRDSVKNKLYKKIKEKGIGAYVGRWNSESETINTSIPDSDDEE